MSLVITGMQNYADIGAKDAAPLATAFDAVGMDWMGRLIAIGACIGLIVVVMILMLGQTRVAFAMARDGLLPPALAKVHPTFRTPWVITAITGVAVAIIGGLVDLRPWCTWSASAPCSRSCWSASASWCCVVPVPTCRARSGLRRSGSWPISSALLCLYLMLNLTGGTWVRFLVWMAIGIVVYAVYGRTHSRLARRSAAKRGTRGHGRRLDGRLIAGRAWFQPSVRHPDRV